MMHTYRNRYSTRFVGITWCFALGYFVITDTSDIVVTLLVAVALLPFALASTFSGVYTTATTVYALNPMYFRRLAWTSITHFEVVKSRGYRANCLGIARRDGKVTHVNAIGGTVYWRGRHKADDILDNIVSQLNQELQVHQRLQESAAAIPQEDTASLNNSCEAEVGFVSTNDILLDNARGCWFKNLPVPTQTADTGHVVRFVRDLQGFEIALTADHITEVQTSGLDAEDCRQAGYYPVSKVTIV
jgi:hypothetical protein